MSLTRVGNVMTPPYSSKTTNVISLRESVSQISFNPSTNFGNLNN